MNGAPCPSGLSAAPQSVVAQAPRVLMLSDVYFPRVNGVSTSIEVTRRHLAGLGVCSTLIAPAYADEESDADVLRVPGRSLAFDPEDRLMRWSNARARAMAEAASGRYDLIHVHTPFVAHYLGVRVARSLGLPLVETYHTHFEEYAEQYLRFLPRPLLRFAARRLSCRQANATNGLVVPSSAMMEVLRAYGVQRPMQRIPTGIEMRDFDCGDRDEFRARLGISPDRRVLLHVGRIAREKNIGFLLQVMSQVRRQMSNVTLLLAGDGPAKSELQGMVRALALEPYVRFLGYLDRGGELQSCYRAADAFVFASRTETQGLVLLEAMACGLPVVSIAEMGTRDLLSQAMGAIVVEEEVGDFATALVDLLRDPPRLALLRREALELASRHTATEQARALLEFYNQVLPSAPDRRSVRSSARTQRRGPSAERADARS